MKKIIYFFAVSILTVMSVSAQKTRTIPAGEITANTTWYSDTMYILDGYVYVKNATITIQAGTVVRGGDPAKKSTLVITRTGKIEARGTASQPIVFTSGKAAGARAPGDWGGIVILGQAIINRPTDCSTCPGTSVAAALPGIQNAIEGDLDNANGDGLYGGTDNTHSSGTMTYVRLEYGGVVITPGNEINGLTLGGVGKGTTLDHIQVTQANDDGFEWFGGNVDAKYLVSNRNIDDDLDTDFGFTGRVQYAVVLRDSSWYDIGSGPTTNGFESDNDGSGTEASPYTDATFSNITVVGPLATGNALSSSTSFQNGARIRRNSSLSLFNSIIMGWPSGLFVDGTRTGQKFTNDSMLFNNNILAGNLNNINSSSANAAAVRTKIVANGTDTTLSGATLLNDPFNYNAPNFKPRTVSGALTGASFTSATRISDAFFTPTTYRGAMGTDDWTQCWCNFNPQNTNYDNGKINNAPIYDAGNDTAICAGRSVLIGKSITGSLKATWSPSTGLNNTTLARPSANPSVTTKYYVTIADTITGCSMIDSITVSVIPIPVADFTSVNGANGLVTFTNTTTGGATTYSWNFGNGSTSTVQNPTNTYTSNGTYNITLTSSNGSCTSTINRLITITGINSTTKAITGDITTNTTWHRDTIYTMNGYVYVKNATLTIESGTIVKGGANRGTLVITRSGILQANGTKNQPIVFTSDKAAGSRAPGDWGGIVMLGQAVINRPTDCSTCPGTLVAASLPGIQNAIEGDLDNANGDGLYGGTDNNHSSGSLTYVRLEFGGVVITPGNEINGLTMGAVGKGTTIHHIQVTQANDDGFEWFGGNVDAKYLVSNRNIDDDLDTDFGFTGRVQYAVVLRDSSWYDIGSGPTTNGFESDNDGSGTEASPYTDPTFSNVTVVGPLANGTALSTSTSFQNGARIRRNSSNSIFNSIIMGWPSGLFIDGTRTGQKFTNDSMSFNNNILAGNLNNINSSSANASAVRAKIVANGTDTLVSASGLLVNPFDYNAPSFVAPLGSLALSGASFTSATRISDAFFTPTSFRGAMGSNPDSNWTNCWCRFNPQNENYTSAPINYPAPLADFSASTPTGRSVSFTNNSSLATSYRWDFGVANATDDTSLSMNPSFVFPANGTYTVTLTSKSICGSSVKTLSVVINDQSSNPVANFSFVQSTATGTNTFTFNNTTDEKGFATTYLWDFGVSNSTTDTSTAKNPTFTFPASGVYDVKLIAFGQFGSDSITKTVTAFSVNVKEVSTTINNISLYPNPTNGFVNVNFNTNKSEEVTIQMTDISGRVVKTIPTANYNSGMNNVLVDASDLNNGLYFVSIKSNNFNKTTRLLISK